MNPATPATAGRPRSRRDGLPALLAALALAAAGAAGAAEVKFFRLQSRASFLPGTLDGIGIDPLGTLRLSDRVERRAAVEEPFLFVAAPHPEGWVLGTGNGGRVLLVRRDGSVATLFTAPEPEIFAVWADRDGTVFAGSSPGGKVYRIAGGTGKPFFDPGQTYIWALARTLDGALLVATGTDGKLFRVDGEGRGTLFYDAEDTHLRSLEVLPGGDVLAGTAGEGLILRLDETGRARTLHDAAQPEVVAFATAPGGATYAAVLASEASLVDLGAGKEAKRPAAGEKEGAGGDEAEGDEREDREPELVVFAGGGEDEGFEASRPKGFKGARSELLRIGPSGVVESVWSFEEETVYSLLFARGRLWVGTGLDGKLYTLEDGKMVLAQDADERQVVALLPGAGGEPGPVFATTNAAALYAVSDRPERRGMYTSPALDAGSIARFGTLRWRGELPPGTGLAFAVRSGMSAQPDATWSPWASALPAGAGQPELPLGAVPLGRYVQWRAQFEAADGASPSLAEVVLSYRQENLAPKIERLLVMDPGQILVPAGFNPTSQVFEPVHPSRQGIFTGLAAAPEGGELRVKPLWKKGYRTLRWEVEDPNGDELTYELLFRPERAGAAWLPLAEKLEDDYLSFDAMALPDGLYRFRLRASDRPSNDPERGLACEQDSDAVVLDHSPPALAGVESEGGRLRVSIADAWSPLWQAEVAVGAAEWKPARAADGLLDARRETLLVDRPAAGTFLLLRVMDASFNVVTFDLTAGEEAAPAAPGRARGEGP